ncbi:hypothetical protein [Paenibacillus sp. Soil787]|uniref:hypothetical protein n=1 Tax=Paenibacillus sp. Soil787 TaxID=1736411 RepID=UPI000701B21C|nr:hypothetical protein [Paenibacillus sp. Soil787]KRF41887.1 hypothetical protein ASG93_22275 [Paenibacillus sp. Soil787]
MRKVADQDAYKAAAILLEQSKAVANTEREFAEVKKEIEQVMDDIESVRGVIGGHESFEG